MHPDMRNVHMWKKKKGWKQLSATFSYESPLDFRDDKMYDLVIEVNNICIFHVVKTITLLKLYMYLRIKLKN